MTQVRTELGEAAKLLQQGNVAAAAAKAQALLDSNAAGDDPALRVYLADLCLQCEMYFDASDIYEPLWPNNPDDPSIRYKAGTAAYRTGKLELAREHFLKCIEVRPDTAATYLQLGHTYRALRDFDNAEQSYIDYITHAKDRKGHGYWSLADLRRHKFGKKELSEMRRHLGKCPKDSAEASIMQFALGNVAERQANYDQALRHYKVANRIQSKLRPFQKEAFQRLLDSLLSADLQAAETPSSDTGRPIFVVGLPRSGTTLVEQILAAHSSVEATDELPYIEHIAYRMEREGGYATGIEQMDDEHRRVLRASYLADAQRHLRSEEHNFIDKNPNNFLHIGLIRCLFPEARIINVRRDLRDNAFSMYRQMFAVGHDHAASFEDMATFAKGYLRLMCRWRQLYPDAIRVQRYEDLVRNPQQQIAGLLEFCGLPEEQGCFEFHLSKQAVMTPSAAQVSQPMYTSSIDYWKNFEQALATEFASLDALQNKFDV